MTKYYLIKDYDSNEKIDVNVEENATEKEAMLQAIEDLGWIFCAKEEND